MSTFSSKGFLPWGNTFDALDETTDLPLFAYNPGTQVFGNRAAGPIDPVNNPNDTGNNADLIQPADDATIMTSYPGGMIQYLATEPLVAGQQYVLSCWIKPAYWNLQVNMSLYGNGNWTQGLQVPGSEGNLQDPTWQTLNGSYQVTRTSITGTDPSVGGINGDVGIPHDIPSNKIIFTKRADCIRATTGSSRPFVFEDMSVSPSVIVDPATTPQSSMSALIKGVLTSTFLYQNFTPPDPSITHINTDVWLRVAGDVVNPISGIATQNSQITAAITGTGIAYTDHNGQLVIRVYPSYLTIGYSWRWEQWGANTTLGIGAAIGIGFFFTGDLAIYGGFRFQDDHTIQNTNYTSCHTGSYTRLSMPFTATTPMAQTQTAKAFPGYTVPLVFSPAAIAARITVSQPSQPKLSDGSLNQSYTPWTPKQASFYAFGWQLDPGTVPLPYVMDPPVNVRFIGPRAPSTFKASTNHVLSLPENEPQFFDGPTPQKYKPNHHIGLNLCLGSTDKQFLNLLKHSNATKVRAGIDATGVYSPEPHHGWYCYKPANVDNELGASWDVFDSRLTLKNVSFTAGSNTFTCPTAGNSIFGFAMDWDNRTLLGLNAPTNAVVTAMPVTSTDGNTFTFTISVPFTVDSDPTNNTYQIKHHLIDDISVLNLDVNGYPRSIPPGGYLATALTYRTTPLPQNYWAAGTYNQPFLPTGYYVLSWTGTGVLSLSNYCSLSPGPFPVTEISRTSNRVVYHIDCSGSTSAGVPVSIKWALGSDNPPWYNAQSGFVLSVVSTDPVDYARDFKLVELQFEDLLNSGEIFYPSFIDRLHDYRTLRFLDWNGGNISKPFSSAISEIPMVDDISWCTANSHVPWEVVIGLCNRLQKNCWLNLYFDAPPEVHKYLSNMFATLLDPKLYLYIEWGNEEWNGMFSQSYYCDLYAAKYGLTGDPTSSNPGWSAHMQAYAKLSQDVFAIWESAFAGSRGLLQPANYWVGPSQQSRRLIRVCSVNQAGATSMALGIYQYAALYCHNADGIPYDAVCFDAYNNDMAGAFVRQTESAVAPALYPWSMSEVISVAWNGLADQETQDTKNYLGLQNNVSSGSPNGILGRDKYGNLQKPLPIIYEGGWGSPGPSTYMLYRIIQLKFEQDGTLETVYNLYKNQMAWWEALVATEPDPIRRDKLIFNLWQSPTTWAHSGQWGITDKAEYTNAEYNSFPIIRAVAESAGAKMSTLEVDPTPPWNPQTSHPRVLVNGTWILMSNYMICQGGVFRHISATTMKYEFEGQFH